MAQANNDAELERAEITVWRDLIAAAPAPLAEATGLAIRAIGTTTAILCPRVDAAEFNRAFGAGVGAPDAATGGSISPATAAGRSPAARCILVRTGPGSASPRR